MLVDRMTTIRYACWGVQDDFFFDFVTRLGSQRNSFCVYFNILSVMKIQLDHLIYDFWNQFCSIQMPEY